MNHLDIARLFICLKILRVQCGEDGVGRRKSGTTAYRATSGRLAWQGVRKRRHWRQRCGLKPSRKVSGGLWPRGGKKR